jgi:hypothetical protein
MLIQTPESCFHDFKEREMVDRYTKAVLTVIAVCLTVIAGRNLVSPGRAQVQGAMHVILDQVAPGAFSYAVPVTVAR